VKLPSRDVLVSSLAAPTWKEARAWGEAARMLRRGPRAGEPLTDAPAVLLVTGWFASPRSMDPLRAHLRARGHRVEVADIGRNIGCFGDLLDKAEGQAARLAADGGIALVGQSRGGILARALAARRPDICTSLVTLGSPLRSPYLPPTAAIPTVFALAALRRAGLIDGMTWGCVEGECCARFRRELRAPLAGDLEAVSIYSRSDGIVGWKSCLDQEMRQVEVDTSHIGMGFEPEVMDLVAETVDGHDRRRR
jgi:triacylglycerol lipase